MKQSRKPLWMRVEARNQLDTVRRNVAHDWRSIAITRFEPWPKVGPILGERYLCFQHHGRRISLHPSSRCRLTRSANRQGDSV